MKSTEETIRIINEFNELILSFAKSHDLGMEHIRGLMLMSIATGEWKSGENYSDKLKMDMRWKNL